jgi:putative sigma-54 modulation protein
MKIQISNRHDTAHPHIKTMIESELGELSSRYEILSADVILDREGKEATQSLFAEVNLKLPGTTLVAKEKSEKIEKSIDLAFKSLQKQLQRHKETHFSSQELRRTAAKIKA